jgi:hypothetical protein
MASDIRNYTGGGPIFPVLATDDRLPAKDVVIGIRAGRARLAILKERIRRAGTITTQAGGARFTAHWDDRLGTARVVRDVSGRQQEPADAFDAMWFAWYAFHPDTEVLR